MDKLKDIQDYLENLATLHTDLLHGVHERVAFARFKSDTQIDQITKKITENIVVIAEVNGQQVGQEDEQQIRRGVAIIFASRASSKGNREAAINTALETSEQIMLDFIARMKEDQANGCDLNFDFENISWNDIDAPWLDSYYGWLMFLPFRGYLPLYNESKWTDS